ncbi:MAG: hypothetical protein WKF83_00850 [Nocardioidaceae bacterium]
MGEPIIHTAETVIDNGSFGTRTIRFETGLPRPAGRRLPSPRTSTTTPCCCRPRPPASKPKDHFDFFPLTIDVEERMYAAGRIPGSFFRREGRPSEDAILTCRLIDRPLRPTFAKGLRNEVQVVITVMALNPDVAYDVLAINAASASTQISGLPFSGPVGGVRVALIDGQWVAFPTHSQLENAVFDMVVAGRRGRGRRRDHDGRGRVHRSRPGTSSEAVPRRRPRRSSPDGLEAAKALHPPAVRGTVRAGRSRCQAGPRVSRSSSTTRTTPTPQSSPPYVTTSPRRSPSPARPSARPRLDEIKADIARQARRAVRGPREGARRSHPCAHQGARPRTCAARQGPHRRPRPRRHPYARRRGRRDPAGPRLGAVRAW